MNVIYVANTRLPTEMAHGLQIMKMCEAFARNGLELELVVPVRFSISKLGGKDPFKYYNVDKNFKIKRIFCFDLTPLNKFLGPISFLIQTLSFSFFSSAYLFFKKTGIIYSRDRFSLFFISFFKKNIFYEVHRIHKFLFKFILKKAVKIIVISEGIKNSLTKKGISKDKILVAKDSIDLKDFNINFNKSYCREKLNLPTDKKLILYTGHLYKWKGVETLAESSKFLDNNIKIVIVGGIAWYLDNFKNFVKRKNLKNIIILGHQDYSKIPYFLKAADCLVLTGTKKSDVSQYQTSPMKMFEYMASSQPIVASDLSSFREVLNEDNALLVKSDDPEMMALGIKKVLNDTGLAKKISEQAYKDVQNYTWGNRAKKILEFIAKNYL